MQLLCPHGCDCVQVRAIFEAAAACKQDGVDVRPEIMVPLIGTLAELKDQEALVKRVAQEVGGSSPAGGEDTQKCIGRPRAT